MSYNAETYVDIKKRLNDWLRNTAGEVNNLPLDLLNRAQNWLTKYRRWTDMMKTVTLEAVTGEVNAYYLPSDMAAFTTIFVDSNMDGKPDQYLYRQARHHDGYEIEDRFTKTAGHRWVVTFYTAPTETPRCYYQKRLDDFQDDETNPQYSFFPGELLLRTAQLIHIEETGLTGPEIRAILDSQEKQIRDYEQAHNAVNNDLRMEIKDDNGHLLSTEHGDLQGNYSGGRDYRGYENDVDLG